MKVVCLYWQIVCNVMRLTLMTWESFDLCNKKINCYIIQTCEIAVFQLRHMSHCCYSVI